MPTINGTTGDDTLSGTNGIDTINGLDGSDVLSGGGGADALDGGDGADLLYSAEVSPWWNPPYQGVYGRPLLDTGAERDALAGGNGDDWLFAGYGDSVDGGLGIDTLLISFLAASAGISFYARLQSQVIGEATIIGIERVAWVQGSEFNDVIDLRLDDVYASTGSSIAEGMGGNDQIFAGYETRVLNGGTGNDLLNGLNGPYLDSLIGGDGDDTLLTLANSAVRSFGGDGNDTITGSGRIYGGAGNDTITLYSSSLVDGGDGDDWIRGSQSTAGAVTDILAGGPGADYIDGWISDDRIGSAGLTADNQWFEDDLGAEQDQLYGGDGNDRISAGYGDTIIAGSGFDQLYYSLAGYGAGITFSTAGMLSNLGSVIGGGGILGIEALVYLRGTDFNDHLTVAGLEYVVTVNAAGGNDVVDVRAIANVYGGDGNDRFIAFAGSMINGGNGNDTIDYSGANFNSFVTLANFGNAGTGSQGTIESSLQLYFVENAIGSTFPDTFIGNMADNYFQSGGGDDILAGREGQDTLSGGAGRDVFRDTSAGLNGDTILDLSSGDKIVITDATIAGFTFSLAGNVLSFTGGSITLASPPSGSLIGTYARGGGVQISFDAPTVVGNDFNGDGRSDILWRADNGQMVNWLGTNSGGFAQNGGNSFNWVDAAWSVAGIGDFNGDGREDILWRNSNGQMVNWLANTSGGFAENGANSFNWVGTNWGVAGIGDFNGDGRDDILWRNSNGQMVNWLANANGNGGFTENGAKSFNWVGTSWSVAGIGDFNGDGHDDVLWRNSDGQLVNWFGTWQGAYVNNGANSFHLVDTAWSVAGIGDFNGDGRDDILWRNNSGQMVNWLGTLFGGFTDNGANSFHWVSTTWQVAAIGDYNGDGRDDILWQNSNGQMVNWLANANGNGGYTENGANSFNWVGTDWQIQSHETIL